MNASVSPYQPNATLPRSSIECANRWSATREVGVGQREDCIAGGTRREDLAHEPGESLAPDDACAVGHQNLGFGPPQLGDRHQADGEVELADRRPKPFLVAGDVLGRLRQGLRDLSSDFRYPLRRALLVVSAWPALVAPRGHRGADPTRDVGDTDLRRAPQPDLADEVPSPQPDRKRTEDLGPRNNGEPQAWRTRI